MNKLIIVAVALAILAGTFPEQAMTVIGQSSQLLSQAESLITPSQQFGLLVVIGLLALAGIKR